MKKNDTLLKQDSGMELQRDMKKALSPYDIIVSLEKHSDGGYNIMLYSMSRDMTSENGAYICPVKYLILHVFPELAGHVHSPLGVFVSQAEKNKIMEQLREIRETLAKPQTNKG